MLDLSKVVKLGVPPAVRDRAVVRCIDHSFGPNNAQNPMITTQWELCGIPQADGSLATTIKRGNVEYKIAGIRCNSVFFTLTPKAIGFYVDIWKAAHPGETLPTEFDENSPDTEWLNGCALQAMIETKSDVQRKALTEEEKEQLRAEGKPIMGDPITDEEGKELTRDSVRIISFLKPYTGELPAIGDKS